MAVQHGYGKIAGADALVFAYDTGDTRNSYKGKPATNLLTTISKGNTDTPLFRIIPGQEVKNVPGMGKRTVEYVDVYNDYNGGSGNCCPSPMFFGDFTVSPSTVYTYQIVYKTATGYAHPNYMYHYEYNGGTYVTEYGLWNSGRIQDLGDGWKHAWGTFTSNASTNRFICYLFHYEYATENRIEVAGVMLTEGNSIIPPSQFLSVNTTRSATQGLLDLTGNSSIDLSNVSFDSNAQMTFDGSNDYANLGSYLINLDTSKISFEIVFKSNISTGGYQPLIGWMTDENPHGYICTGDFTGYWGNESISFFNYSSGGVGHELSFAYTNGHAFLNDQNYHHVVFTLQSADYRIYVDGVEVAVNPSFRNGSPSSPMTSNLFGYGNTPSVEIGRGSNAAAYANVTVPLVKIYNRVLTAAEVAQNYRHYKTRFGI